MLRFFKLYQGLILRLLGTLVVSAVLSILFMPSILTFIEQSRHTIVGNEQVMRVSVGLLLFFFYTLVMAWHGFPRTRWVVWGLSLFIVGLLFIFLFDTHHVLREEMSWVRWFTGFALIVAAGIFIAGSLKQQATFAKWPWCVLGVVFLFAAGDELFQWHELFGSFVESRTGINHAFTDFITFGYALLGLIAGTALYLADVYKNPKARGPFLLLVAGVLIFLVAMIFDTLDYTFESVLQVLAMLWGSREQQTFSDFWIVLRDPSELFNFLEESLEYLAALIFVASAGALFYPTFFNNRSYRIDAPRHVLSASFFTAFLAFGFILLGLFPPTFGTPIVSELWTAERLLGPEDGTKHSDDIAWHPAWDIVVANESGPNVLRVYNDGAVLTLPDPQRLLTDVDSLAVTSDALFVSDSTAGIIYQYRERAGWEVYVQDAERLPHPEGLFVNDDTLYVVDESVQKVFAIDRKTRALSAILGSQEGLEAPEDVIMLSNGTLLVTDDVSGKIWQYRNGVVSSWGLSTHLEPEALFETDEGTVWVSDNRNRTITYYTAEGTALEVITFALNYEDIQGVAADRNGNVYAVTADGYASSTVIPSYLWKLTRKQ